MLYLLYYLVKKQLILYGPKSFRNFVLRHLVFLGGDLEHDILIMFMWRGQLIIY